MRDENQAQQLAVRTRNLGGRIAILASACCVGPLSWSCCGVISTWICKLRRLASHHSFFLRAALST